MEKKLTIVDVFNYTLKELKEVLDKNKKENGKNEDYIEYSEDLIIDRYTAACIFLYKKRELDDISEQLIYHNETYTKGSYFYDYITSGNFTKFSDVRNFIQKVYRLLSKCKFNDFSKTLNPIDKKTNKEITEETDIGENDGLCYSIHEESILELKNLGVGEEKAIEITNELIAEAKTLFKQNINEKREHEMSEEFVQNKIKKGWFIGLDKEVIKKAVLVSTGIIFSAWLAFSLKEQFLEYVFLGDNVGNQQPQKPMFGPEGPNEIADADVNVNPFQSFTQTLY
jgi:hypothetical protein